MARNNEATLNTFVSRIATERGITVTPEMIEQDAVGYVIHVPNFPCAVCIPGRRANGELNGQSIDNESVRGSSWPYGLVVNGEDGPVAINTFMDASVFADLVINRPRGRGTVATGTFVSQARAIPAKVVKTASEQLADAQALVTKLQADAKAEQDAARAKLVADAAKLGLTLAPVTPTVEAPSEHKPDEKPAKTKAA